MRKRVLNWNSRTNDKRKNRLTAKKKNTYKDTINVSTMKAIENNNYNNNKIIKQQYFHSSKKAVRENYTAKCG